MNELRTTLYEETVPGGGHTSFVLKRGQVLRLTDIEGGGNLSLLLFNAADWVEVDGALYSNDSYLPDPGVAAGTGLYGQDPFRWESDLTLTRLKPDGTVYRDEDLERDVLQEWMACYGEPPRDAWAWAVLDDITHDYLEEEAHELERLHAA